ncbi:MAG: anaerobic glycerol-3-phosphate dehydrogenase subunit GlpB [Bacillota bacterium]
MTGKITDILIIGAGLSGLTAAARAAATGKKVLVAARGMGAVGLSSGCIDLWGYCLDQPDLICTHPLREIERLVAGTPEHPYSLVLDVLGESLDFFQDICLENGLRYLDNGGKNWVLPTAMGTVRPTYLAPESMAAGPPEEYRRVLVAGFRELKDFHPNVLAANIGRNAGLSPGCVIDIVVINTGSGTELSPVTLAHRLEDPGMYQMVLKQLEPHVTGECIVLAPPVLGGGPGPGIALKLSRDLGCKVCEVTGMPPSMPGQRLQQTLIRHLLKTGVEVIHGCTVTGANVSGRRCTGVTVTGAGGNMKINANYFILATGSFLGGGLEAGPDRVSETVFGLPVKTTCGEWTEEEFLGRSGHPFSRFGIVANSRLQPLDSRGRPIIENLAVAGANLAGSNYPIEKCGNGVAVATGYKAGILAGDD